MASSLVAKAVRVSGLGAAVALIVAASALGTGSSVTLKGPKKVDEAKPRKFKFTESGTAVSPANFVAVFQNEGGAGCPSTYLYETQNIVPSHGNYLPQGSGAITPGSFSKSFAFKRHDFFSLGENWLCAYLINSTTKATFASARKLVKLCLSKGPGARPRQCKKR
jgi:hypothetical protein